MNEEEEEVIPEMGGHDTYLEELVFELFKQGCSIENGKYDHGSLSTYEEAQRYLLFRGLILEEDCLRK